jgi:hypothetical protein
MDIYLPIAEVSLDFFCPAWARRRDRLPVGRVRGRRRVSADAAADLYRRAAGGRRRLVGNQLVGASVSGVLAHWRRGNVDFKMGFVLLRGGLPGRSSGVWLFTC